MSVNVLIVDDSHTTRVIMRKILSITDIEWEGIFEAENGEMGLEVLYRNKIHLVLLDIKMPIMDGMQMAKEMKNNLKFSDIPIILITSDATQHQHEEAERLGILNFIAKPFDHADIKQVIQNSVEDVHRD